MSESNWLIKALTGNKKKKMESDSYYNRNKSFNYKAVFYSIIGIAILIFLIVIYK